MRSKIFCSVACLLLTFPSVVAQEAGRQAVLGFATVTISPGFQMIANPLNARDNTVGALLKSVPDGTMIYKLSEGNTNALAEPARALLQQMMGIFPTEVDAPVNITLAGMNVELAWKGALQASPEVAGPYRAIPDVVSPIQVPILETQQFWRARKSISVISDFPRFTANAFQSGAWSDPAQTLQPGEGAIIFNPSALIVTVTFTGEVLQGDLDNSIPEGLSIRSSMLPKSGGISSKLGLQLAPGDHVFKWMGNRFESSMFVSEDLWAPSEPQFGVGESLFIYAYSPATWKQNFSSPR
jgi:hypothetical protein